MKNVDDKNPTKFEALLTQTLLSNSNNIQEIQIRKKEVKVELYSKLDQDCAGLSLAMGYHFAMATLSLKEMGKFLGKTNN